MATAVAIARKTNPLLLTSKPLYLTWRSFGFRGICNSSHRGFLSSPQPSESEPLPPEMAGTKVLESFTEEFEIGSRLISFETGKIARFANGSVVMGMEDTKVLSTVASSKGDGGKDFLPLTVDYQEKQFAQGVIPTTFMRREGAPKERELLCGRIIDRPIRPLFPSGFYHEVQVMASVLSSDGKQDPDVMAANATSAALMLSDIPWGGPIGVIRIGRIGGQFVVNPSMDELTLSDLNLVYACTRDKTLMIDVQACEISERDLESALRMAHPEAVKYLEPQIRLAAKAGKHKKEYKLSMISEATLGKIKVMAESSIEAVFTDPTYGKFERGEALDNITQSVRKVLVEEGDEENLKVLPKAVDTVRKQVVRKRVIEKGLRVDGRRLDEVRPLYCESGYLPTLHGSSIFSRGDTQVLCTVTLGAPGDAQRLDSLVGPPRKRFMLHYSFPPFSINEVGKRGGLNRREVGHGTLAEKALLAVLPPEDDFPYTVRVNSEVMASDGSTSMATVCGGSMALMDAGIPVREHVAGVSVGLVTEVDPDTGVLKDYRILTDILGLEDHLGDMDFKIAGTRKGVTAIQLDIKPAGIPLDIICESLEPALKGRLQILDHMERQINAPRTQDERNSPRLATLKYSNESLRRLIGPQGVLKRKIEEETGVRMSLSDGKLTMLAKNQNIMEKALEMVDSIVGREIEVGGIYKGVVSSVKEYGAFVEFNGGQQGLLHISELSHDQVSRVSDVVSIGQQLSLMCIGQDVRGNIKLSLRATLPQNELNNSISEGSVIPVKQAPNVWASVADTPNDEESQELTLDKLLVREDGHQEEPGSVSLPSIVIRSAAECDENEHQEGPGSASSPSILIRSAAECDEEALSAVVSRRLAQITDKRSPQASRSKRDLEPDRKSKTSPPLQSNKFFSLFTSIGSTLAEKVSSKVQTPAQNAGNDRIKGGHDTSTSVKSLKLGDRLNGKVYLIKAHGIVLDLGGGIRGMYRFKENGRKEFEIGEELEVECSSFSTKGIPIVSLLEDE